MSQTPHHPEDFYKERVTILEKELRELKTILRRFIIYRLLAFFAVIYTLFFISGVHLAIRIALPVLCLALFGYLIKENNKKKELRKKLQIQNRINEDELKCLQGDYSQFGNGDEYRILDHDFAHDLDLFGHSSLFQYLNRSSLSIGAGALARWMSDLCLDKNEIESRQKAIEELSTKTVWRQEFKSYGELSGETPEDIHRILLWGKEDLAINSGGLSKVLMYLIPVYSIVITLMLSMSLMGAQMFSILILIPLFIAGAKIKQTTDEYKKLGEGFKALSRFSLMFEKLENEEFKSQKNSELKSQAEGASLAFGKLYKIMEAFDNRNNFIVVILGNIYWSWDIRCMSRLKEWHLENASNIESWLNTLATMDAFCSLANFKYNQQEDAIFPSITDDNTVEAKDLGHPFLLKEDRVDNDYKIDFGSFSIITGANMAGKSTFLRTLGVNMVLSMCGGPVLAKEFSITPMSIYSSMRTSDSLQKNESYFYTELKRLHELIIRLEKGEKLFIILDEILKGTNSKDKAEGSMKFVDKLLHLDSSGLIATHDLSLCEIEKQYPDRIQNLFFDVEIENDDLSFDYKLRHGICSNMNATFLMKKMGITE